LLFVQAETPEKLDAGLAALAEPEILDLPEKKARDDKVKIRAALGWLERHPVWLMMLDNVDDRAALAAVAKLLPRLRGGRVLITGRLSNFPAGIRKLELGEIDIKDAVAFLLERTEAGRRQASDDAIQAGELARELGGLALGLEQAAAFIVTQRIGFAEYLALWRDSRAKMVDWFDKELMAYNHDVGLAATWKTSVDRLTPDGRRLLELLSFFDPAPIPEALLGAAAPSFEARAALIDLYAYSLAVPTEIEGKPSVSAFAVHRLVQDFTKRGMNAPSQRGAIEEGMQWIKTAFAGNPQDVRNWPVLDPLAPHVLALVSEADKVGITGPISWLMNHLGALFVSKARYMQAEPMFRRALAINEASYGSDHPDVANLLNSLAVLLRVTNRLAEAEPMFRRALEIDEAIYGPDHPVVANRLANLAGLLSATNRKAEAESMFQRALAINEAIYGPDHPEVARCLNNFARLLSATNRQGEAEAMFRRALTSDEASYGPDHPVTANRLANLAGLLSATNRLAEAEPMFRRALAIDEANYGQDHSEVAIRLSSLAGLLRATNRLAEAEPMFRRALAIDLAEAEAMFRRALAILEMSLGLEHPHTCLVRKNLNDLTKR
jgi:tetratricopeptide (TPR) repeat protein